MLNLTPDQRALGRANSNEVIGSTRRDFLKAAAVAPAMGAFYFGYQSMGDKPPVKAAIIGTGNEGCGAMIHDHNRDYVNFIGLCDIRPSQEARGVKEFSKHKQYSEADVAKLKKYADVDEMLADNDVEMVVIALPLWLHAPIAIKALNAGKHVFCEKLMAHNVSECKEMVKTAHAKNRLLAIGHQRHYSALYDNANYLVQEGHLGEIRHIRALWHRNNAVPQIKKDANGKLVYDDKGEPVYVRDEANNIVYFDGWKPPIPDADKNIDFAKYGYKSLDELVRWRLYNRTGAGLMAELGSHQLDACSIFLGKKHPLAVTGIGGTFFYTDKREVDDHVFVNFEFPGKAENDHTVVTYSSINTNAFETYGEELMGTRGTMIVEGEKEILLYKEVDRNTWKPGDSASGKTTTVTVENNKAGKPVVEASPSAAGPSAAASLGNLATADPSRGYREELEHFAYCIRHGNESNFHDVPDKDKPRCRGEVALADAVIALTSNMAMREKRRIEFNANWFDWQSPEVPETGANQVARKG
jgi:predicted dehydrogenase